MKLISDKYKPKSISEIISHKYELEQLVSFIKNYKNQKKKSILLYGPTGTGKTSAIYAISNELDLEILELNASDLRNSDQIEQVIKPALEQQSLFSKSKIILIDEVDGISKKEDRGGIPTILKLIEKSPFPVIIIANNPWERNLNQLRSRSQLVEFKILTHFQIIDIIKDIAKKESINIKDEVILIIAKNSEGDMRAALNDLHLLAANKQEISKKDLEMLGNRQKKESIFNALKAILKEKDIKSVYSVTSNLDIDLDELFLWLDENIPYEYRGQELVEAYDALSRADVFRGRIIRQQYYRFLVYQSSLMTSGVSLSKKNIKSSYISYKRTSRILKIWMTNKKNSQRKEITQKLSTLTHSSTKKVLRYTMPYFNLMFKNNKDKVLKVMEINKDN